MKRIFFALLVSALIMPAVAQPPARLREAAKKTTQQSQTQAVTVSERAQLDFPSQAPMPDDVAWRRDIYRIIDLSKDRNAVLYYPQEPQGDKMNLFTYLFKLVMRKQIPAYNYTMDGIENLSPSNQIKPLTFLTDFKIRYEQKGDQFRIEDSDIPSADILLYYIKECSYFDQHTATFHTQVIALCPVGKGDEEFGGNSKPYFWVKYSDIAPYLAKLSLMGSNYNNAASISADDYFTTNKYEGKIYKTNNLQGKVLANYCTTDSAMAKEQKRIEGELAAFEKSVWGSDSINEKKMTVKAEATAATDTKTEKATKKSSKDDGSTSSRSQLKRERTGGNSGSSSSSKPRISVRRQRH